MKLTAFKNAKWIILGIFLLSFVTDFTFLFIAKEKGIIYDDSFRLALFKVISIYSTHFAVIFISAFRTSVKRKGPVHNTRIFYWAMACSIVWNSLTIVRIALFTFSLEDEIEDLIKYLDMVPAQTIWLVSGLIIYYFNKENLTLGRTSQ